MRIRIIYLAAGFSRRFGANKLLFPIEGKELYRHLLERWMDLKSERTDIGEIVVVTRYEEICDALKAAPVLTVKNEHSHLGISSSLKLGILAGSGEEFDAYLCSVADQPYLSKKTMIDFINGFKKSGCGIGVLQSGEAFGNPVIFSSKYREELLELCGDQGGKQVVNAHPEDVWVLKEVPAEELEDIDYN